MACRPHTEACRQRMENILREKGEPRWARAKERADERVWEEIQRQVAQEESHRVASQEEEGRKDKKRQQQQGEATGSSRNLRRCRIPKETNLPAAENLQQHRR